MSSELKIKEDCPSTDVSEVIIQGITVRLVFATEKNMDIPARVRDILRSGYLHRQGV